MPKLQRIKRSNGSLVFSVNIPLELIEELDWEKGQELSIEIKKVGINQFVMIFKNEEEEKNDITI